ncbi:uncharacterized protein EDB91DRAFT_1146585 [Suillus paluster]|uniref:uncharacterized protein n=1 Tax=Suillus paluster TaxID=48578 RepID=UPI001B86B985|nr:uncharacterized protein EDB91DRAFT_1146585 [Suillus paluster]KAG1734736.1 hypothetical protein EDB91DRAFT_1146585 [Suillus paluster]
MLLLPLTLFFSSWHTFVYAGSQAKGQNCSVSNNRLEIGTYQFHSDCDTQTYCSSQGTCELKGCRKDQYPFGYAPDAELPPKCPSGQFCPDEGDGCQPWLPVGSACQLNRDDQCEPPPNWQDLDDTSKYGRNVNGSVCLNNVCMWTNVTVGLPCQVENTAYIAYAGTNEFVDIVSRGNCQVHLYCDAQSLVCIQAKQLGETCDADKECLSFNCESNGVCGTGADSPNHFGIWAYSMVGLGIFGGMFATLITLFLVHRRQRDQEREKRLQYWREQNAFRQSIIQMKEMARTSILSLPGHNSNRSTVCSRAGSEEPMLQHSVHKASGLRQQYMSDDNGSMYDDMMMQSERQ